MTPKEKAKELVFKFTRLDTNNQSYAYDIYCAIIAVDFAKENPLNTDGYNKYLQEVKSEIEKL